MRSMLTISFGRVQQEARISLFSHNDAPESPGTAVPGTLCQFPGTTVPGLEYNAMMNEIFILIPGRTSKQGTTMNEGKLTQGYIDEINTLQMNADDMARLHLKSGDKVRVKSEQGVIELPCVAAKAGELPAGLLFLPYGDQ